MQRLAKIISNAGICSRREAEELIFSGKVKVDGLVVTTPSRVVSDNNKIEVSGKLIQSQKPRLWLYYKPVGLITTHKDPQERKTVFEALSGLPRVISVGRLDLNSEGLLLLTNNGDLARSFELPSSNIERVYKVRVHGNPNQIRFLKFPLTINNVTYNPKSIKILKTVRSNSWFEVILAEGKNREIRKIFEHVGLKVNRLIRVKYGSFLLGNLKPGEYKEQPYLSFKNFIKND